MTQHDVSATTCPVSHGVPVVDGVYDPVAREFEEDPVRTYNKMRDLGPVVWSERDNGWMLTTHEGVSAALMSDVLAASMEFHPDFGSLFSPDSEDPILRTVASSVFGTASEHKRRRRSVFDAFTKRAVVKHQPLVVGLVEERLGGAVEGTGGEATEFAWSELAQEIPVRLMGEVLGLSAADLDEFGRLAPMIAKLVSPAMDMDMIAGISQGLEMLVEMLTRNFDDADERGDDPTVSLVARLAGARADGSMTNDECVAMGAALLVGGVDTSTHMIDNIAFAFNDHPEWLERIATDPELSGVFVDEAFRVYQIGKSAIRFVVADVVLSGVQMRTGDMVILPLWSTNNDPAAFVDAAIFDPGRSSPNPSLTFGRGPHHCVGAQLARVDGVGVAATTARLVSELKLDGQPQLLGHPVMRAVAPFKVTVKGRVA